MDVWAKAGIGGGKSASEGTCYKEREIMDYKQCEKLTQAILAVATNLKYIFYAMLFIASLVPVYHFLYNLGVLAAKLN